MIEAVIWKNDHLDLLDQTLLPEQTIYLELTTSEQSFEAIRNLRVRGAPAIGITAAYGLFLGMNHSMASTREEFLAELDQKIEYLSSARPTAVNLFWALDEMKKSVTAIGSTDVDTLKSVLLARAKEIHKDDRQRCQDIGDHGKALIPNSAGILTHCNAGAHATGGIGTALGVIYKAHSENKNIKVYADETRPILQGARLTAWELNQAGVPVELICDSMSGTLMQQKKIDLVIVGADRIAADGSVANKIGTYNVAVLAAHHNIPFYVAAPLSTFDMNLDSGDSIPIEIRDSDEIRNFAGKAIIALPEIDCWNPAFDVTPPELITGIITEKGVIKPPYKQNIQLKIESAH